MTADSPYTLGLLLETKRGVSYDRQPELEIRVRLVKVEADRKIRNFNEYDGEKFLYADLGWHAMIYLRDNAPWVVDHDYGYAQLYCLSSRLAKRAYHTLCQVDAKMVRMETHLGRTTDWPALVARFGRALGVQHFITQVENGRNGWSYDQTDFAFHAPGACVAIIQGTIDGWVENLRKEQAA